MWNTSMKSTTEKIANLGGDVFGPVRLPDVEADESTLAAVVSYVFIIIGIISVIMIMIASLQYITSTGDPQKTKKAKDTILYAVIGVVISVSAWSIISFVLDRT